MFNNISENYFEFDKEGVKNKNKFIFLKREKKTLGGEYFLSCHNNPAPDMFPAIYLSIYLSIYQPICLSTYLIHPSTFLSINLSISPPIHPSTYLSINLSISPPIHPSTYLPINLWTYLSIYPKNYKVKIDIFKVIMKGKLILLYCNTLSLGDNVNTRPLPFMKYCKRSRSNIPKVYSQKKTTRGD